MELPEIRLSDYWARYFCLEFGGAAFKKLEDLCVCITDFLPINNIFGTVTNFCLRYAPAKLGEVDVLQCLFLFGKSL